MADRDKRSRPPRSRSKLPGGGVKSGKSLQPGQASLPQSAGAEEVSRQELQRQLGQLQARLAELEKQNIELLAWRTGEHEQAREALRESEARYRAIMDQAADAVFVHDSAGSILDVNQQACQNLGYSREELLGMKVEQIDPDAVRSAGPEAWHKILAGEHVTIESNHIRKDGSRYPVEVRLGAVHAAGGMVIVAIVRDLTIRRQTEAALRESERRHWQLIENAPVGVFYSTSEGKFLSVNLALAAMMGYSSREELMEAVNRASIADTLYAEPDQRTPLVETVQNLGGGWSRTRRRYRRKDGTTFLANLVFHTLSADSPHLLEGFVEDISHAKQAEEITNFLAQTAGRTGDESFFNALARYLAESLQMDFICIDRLEGDGLTATTLAVWHDGKFEDNITYSLKDTPCGEVVGRQVCCYPASVCKLFPRDEVLKDLRAESYAGVTLWSHDGKPIGIIAVISRRELANREQVETVLKLVAPRAASELERMDAERTLRASEERYRILAENSDDYVVLTHVEHGSLYVSPSYYRTTGWTEEDIRNISWKKRVHPDDWALIERAVAANRRGESTCIEHRVLCKDGSWIWVENRCQPIKNSAGKVETMVQRSRDITKRRQAEAELLRSQSLLNATGRMARVGGWEYCVSSGSLAWTDEVYHIHEVGEDFQPTVDKAVGFYTPESRPLIAQAVQRAIEHAEPFDLELQIDTARGRRRWVHAIGEARVVDGRVAAVGGTFQDITDRREAQEALRASEQKYRELVEHANSIILHWTQDGTITFLNEFGQKFFGYSAAEIVGRHVVGAIVPETETTGRDLRPLINQVCADPAAFEKNVNENIRRNGERVWVAWTNKVDFDEQGRIAGIVSTGTDITELKHAQDALRRSEVLNRRLVEHLPHRVFIKDRNSVYLSCNANYALDLGVAIDDVVGKDDFAFHQPELARQYRADDQAVMASGQAREIEERYYLGGQERWARTVKVPYRDDKGEIVGVLGMFEDITESKQVREEVRRERDRAQGYLDTVEAIIVALDSRGCITLINQKGCRLLGYEESELLGRSWFELCLPQPQGMEKIYPYFLKLIRGETQGAEYLENPVLTRDGRLREIAWHNRVLHDEAGRIIGTLSAGEDITERKLAQDSLAKSEESYRKLFDSMLDGFALHEIICDAAGRPCDYRFLEVNPAFEAMTGLRGEDIVGKTVREVLPVVEDGWIQRYGKVALTGQSERFEDFSAALNKHFEVMAFRPAEGQFATVVADVTARKRAEKALANERLQLRTLIDSLPDPIYIKDAQSRFVVANMALARLSGLSDSSRFIGKTDADFFSAEDARRYREDELQVMSGEGIYGHEEWITTGDGLTRWMSTTKIPLRDESGHVVGLVGVNRDLTAHKLAEEALAAERLQLRTLIDNLPGPVYVKDTESRFVVVNAVMAKHAAVDSPDRIIGRTDADFFPPEIACRFREEEERLMREGRAIYGQEQLDTTPDGVSRWWSVTKIPLRDAGGKVYGLLGINRDITEQKQAADAVAKERRQLRSLIDNLPYSIYFKDLESRFVVANQTAANIAKQSNPELMIGRTDADYFSPELADRYRAEEMEVMRDGKVIYNREDCMTLPDGEIQWSSITKIPLRDERGNIIGLVGVNRDITPQKKAAEILRKKEREYRDLVETLPAGIVVHAADSSIIISNPMASQLLGLTEDQMRGKTAMDPAWCFLRDDETPMPLDEYPVSKILSSGEPVWGLVVGVKRPDAVEPTWVLCNGYPLKDNAGTIVQVIVTFADITDRKRAEAALFKREQRHRTILHTAMDGFWMVDTEGRLLEVNESYCRMSGYTAQELLGKHIGGIEGVENTAEVARRIEHLLRAGHQRFESRHRRKDGSLFDVEVSIQYQPSENRIVVFIRDITQQKNAQAEREKLEAQLRQSQKMESVGRLAGGVAHDFNNMLGVILGHVDMAMLKMDSRHPLHMSLTEIRKAAQRSADLTRQLLAFARKQTVAPKVLNINEAVENSLKLLKRLIGENINLSWTPAKEIWPVRVDPTQFDQILTNLCVNAGQAIADVGSIFIETANCTLTRAQCENHADFTPGEYVCLTVADTGCGMDTETLSHLFEPFFTTKGVGKGTGLGLATVYGAIRQNDGFVGVFSQPGIGSTFKIYLPRHTGKTSGAKADEPHPSLASGQETILLVEDEPSILKMTALMLQSHGYRVVTANTPGEAIRLAREHAGDIHLLVTDVVMPEMNGRSLAQNLLSLYPDMKRLFMSGYTADVIAHHGVLDEGVQFIQKPFSINELAAKVREALDQK